MAMLPTNLDMDVLRALVIAMEHGGFARAAERLGRTQSAISLQMKKLEEQVGQPLFRKAGRTVALTDAGDLLLGYARRIVALNDEALSAARGRAMDGTVRVGFPQDLAERWLPAVLGSFHRDHPRIHVEAQVGRGRELRERVAQGALDLALAFGEIGGNPGATAFGAVTLAHLPVAWVAPGGFHIDVENPLPLALLDSPCMFRQHGIERLDGGGRPWRITFTSPSLSGLWAAVEAGLGITIRTPLGLPDTLAILDPHVGLPELGSVPLELHRAPSAANPAVDRLHGILADSLAAVLRDAGAH
ncbi:DNA-binding transcriptional LysR family regulator [Azospirillum lipoferum]|uniref:LysR family transcriptional regulator n=1 Tax=Azospirillum lipoferum TaxID=193 RepID=A0A5A9GJ50_AZOLI|nr:MULTISPECIES: LysR substrate-binding domain-containing protein [Azospirillum]KAA0594528.1 LysR family transcriptional regulator [Azospirillum lipoferum]MCP1613285.1 DNA-binding transcriptional LysR family regulator [Azospirillum lipoferum]MDW5531484.1 LysR substrate-binding domain-containing protein [Azospirillum sp. NL1]